MTPAEKTSQEKPATGAPESSRTKSALSDDGRPVRIEPDLGFIQQLGKAGGNSFEKCFQCGTCSATCTIAPDTEPFPRKEMAWAAWGMKDRLLSDPDVWLCYQCNDCSTRCPRGARPGDVLAAVRRESVLHYAVPRFLGRWAGQPQCIPLLLGIPAALLTLALLLKGPIENALDLSTQIDEKIIYSYSSVFPHWLLNGFFMFFSVLVLLAMITGVVRFWQSMKGADARGGIDTPVKSVLASIVSTLGSIIAHSNFTKCTEARSRFLSHMCVFFGFMALSAVTTWVITAGFNPLIQHDFVYPFGFWSPWKILANVGGIAVVAGCLLMIRNRLKDTEHAGPGTYFDWALIATLLVVAITGFFTEALHYVRLEPHRHIAYFVHLVFVGALLFYLPYSKLAHMIYRTTAMVFAEYSGRNRTLLHSGETHKRSSGEQT